MYHNAMEGNSNKLNV